MIPDVFTQVGVRLDLLISGWVGLGLLVITILLVTYTALVNSVGGDIGGGVAIFTGILGLLAGGIWLVLMFPYQGQYQHLYRTTATVESVSNVLEQADGDLTRTPVVELSGLDRPAVVDDPRIVRLEGATVTFTCRIAWHYQAADTYSCDIYSIDREAAS